MINIVIGAGFGDEGKGQTVAKILNSQAGSTNFVVRFNGGQQAGHTVEHNGKRHVFSNFAAGTLHGVKSYWSQHCTFHPTGIRNEHGVLTDLGEDPELWIDPLCPITLPHDISFNLDRSVNDHGTVGVGFGTTIERNENHFRIHAHDLLDWNIFIEKLDLVEKHYYKKEDTQKFIEDCIWLMKQKKIRIARPPLLVNPILEGAQGILLDEEFGFYPHVTRSKTTAVNALKVLLQFGCMDNITINYVSRSYHTRHGNGPFAHTPSGYLKLKDDFKETNQTNEHQGEFRKSILDLGLLEHAIRCCELEIGPVLPRESMIHFTCHDHHKEDTFWTVNKGLMQLMDKKLLQEAGDEIVANV